MPWRVTSLLNEVKTIFHKARDFVAQSVCLAKQKSLVIDYFIRRGGGRGVEIHEGMIDHCSYKHNLLGAVREKPEKCSGLNENRTQGI